MTRTVPIQHFVLIFTMGAAMQVISFRFGADNQVNAKYHGWYAAIALPSALLAVGLLVHDWIAPMFHLSNIDYTQGRPLSSQPGNLLHHETYLQTCNTTRSQQHKVENQNLQTTTITTTCRTYNNITNDYVMSTSSSSSKSS